MKLTRRDFVTAAGALTSASLLSLDSPLLTAEQATPAYPAAKRPVIISKYTGAQSAMTRKRSSVSRSKASARLRSVMSVEIPHTA